MNLLQMSVSGAVMITAVILLRAAAAEKLPKKTFPVLWFVVLLRLFLPFQLPSPSSAYNFIPDLQTLSAPFAGANGQSVRNGGNSAGVPDTNPVPSSAGSADPNASANHSPTAANPGPAALPDGNPNPFSVFGLDGFSGTVKLIWLAGAFLFAVYFLTSYVRCRRRFDESLPAQGPYVKEWLKKHPLRRSVSIRVSSRIQAPLTYKVLHPVILLPKTTDWENTPALDYVLEHEFIHIRRLDAAAKLLLTAALCLHWFNPFVWIMFILANRDIELACDEGVIRSFGLDNRSAYALTLIGMEEQKGAAFPLVNSFNKNAIEERIRAIMKMKRVSIAAVLTAVLIVVGISAVFATSAAQKKQEPPQVTPIDACFTADEFEQLHALQFDGYETMNVHDFQEKVWQATDTLEYSALLDRFAQDEHLYAMRDTDETASFLTYALTPLTAENWRNRHFPGYVFLADGTEPYDNRVSFEYDLSLEITDAKKLTVGDYLRTIQGVRDAFDEFIRSQSREVLSSQTSGEAAFQSQIELLTSKWETDALRLSFESSFQPYDAAEPEPTDVPYNGDEKAYLKALQESVQSSLLSAFSPYFPFGLTYEFTGSIEKEDYDIKLYFNGTEVRGIWDPNESRWVTTHAGNTAYSADAVELIAIYENGTITGLRQAAPEEQAEWDALRNNRQPAGEEEEARDPATEEDYRSLLTLKTDGYRDRTVAEFNYDLLSWCNDHFDASERISQDTAFQDIQASLTPEEQAFVTVAYRLSCTENTEKIRSERTGNPEKDPGVGEINLYREPENSSGLLWFRLYYQFSYHIQDDTVLTVGERDDRISAVMGEIQKFWNEADPEDLLSMNRDDVVEKLAQIAAQYSDEQLTITLPKERCGFEAMDERKQEE